MDPQALASLLAVIGSDKASLCELIESFLLEGPKLIDRLNGESSNRDGKGVSMVAHTQKTSLKDFSAASLAAECQALEALAAGRSVSNENVANAINNLVEKICRDYPTIEAALITTVQKYRDADSTAQSYSL